MGVIHKGRWSPLQVLDEKDLGLVHEANEVFWQSEYRIEYAALRNQNFWRMQTSKKVMPDGKKQNTSVQWASQEQVVDHFARQVGPAYGVLAVHPVFYGMRPHKEEAPLPVRSVGASLRLAKGVTFEAYDDAHCGEVQAIFERNEHGVAGTPLGVYRSGNFKVLFLGGENFLTEKLPSDSKIPNMVVKRSNLMQRNRLVGHYTLPYAHSSNVANDRLVSLAELKRFIETEGADMLVVEQNHADSKALKDLNQFGLPLVLLVPDSANDDQTSQADWVISISDILSKYEGRAQLRLETGLLSYEGHNQVSIAINSYCLEKLETSIQKSEQETGLMQSRPWWLKAWGRLASPKTFGFF